VVLDQSRPAADPCIIMCASAKNNEEYQHGTSHTLTALGTGYPLQCCTARQSRRHRQHHQTLLYDSVVHPQFAAACTNVSSQRLPHLELDPFRTGVCTPLWASACAAERLLQAQMISYTPRQHSRALLPPFAPAMSRLRLSTTNACLLSNEI
jgi:hypothetical protein